jgi:hypothetical protein
MIIFNQMDFVGADKLVIKIMTPKEFLNILEK